MGVPDVFKSSAAHVLSGLAQLQRRLNIAACMPSREHRPSRCRAATSWRPPSNACVTSFINCVKETLTWDYVPCVAKPNTSCFDRQARAWLRRNDEVVVVDLDKNLGDALCSRRWIKEQCS